MLLHALIEVLPRRSSPAAWLPDCLHASAWEEIEQQLQLWGHHQPDIDTRQVLNSPGEVPLHPCGSGRLGECLPVWNAESTR